MAGKNDIKVPEPGTQYRCHDGRLLVCLNIADNGGTPDMVLCRELISGRYDSTPLEKFFEEIVRPSGQAVPRHWPEHADPHNPPADG